MQRSTYYLSVPNGNDRHVPVPPNNCLLPGPKSQVVSKKQWLGPRCWCMFQFLQEALQVSKEAAQCTGQARAWCGNSGPCLRLQKGTQRSSVAPFGGGAKRRRTHAFALSANIRTASRGRNAKVKDPPLNRAFTRGVCSFWPTSVGRPTLLLSCF